MFDNNKKDKVGDKGKFGQKEKSSKVQTVTLSTTDSYNI